MVDQSTHPTDYDWFRRQDYVAIRDFTFSDWATMLQIRANSDHAWSRNADHLTAGQNMGDVSTARDFWETYLSIARPCNHCKLLIGRKELRTLPLVEDITTGMDDWDEDKAASENVVTQFFGARIVRINVNAPDSDLKEALKKFIQELRRHHPLPVRRRGRRSSNVMITDEGHLASWTSYNVLGVIDLDLCSKVFNIPKLSYEKLCDILLGPRR